MRHPEYLKITPFAPYYGEGVVEWLDIFGYGIPLSWGDVPAEYNAVRNHAAAMEFSMLLKFDVRGDGAIETVNKVFSRDISGMTAGKIAYGCIVNDDGMMIDDYTVFVYGPEHVRMIGANEVVREYLERTKSANVTITEHRDELAQLSVQGPKSRKILQKLTSSDLSNEGLRYYNFITNVDLAGIPTQISRLGFTGELGYELIIPADRAGDLWAALNKAGHNDGLLPAGGAVVMTCRVEAGLIMGGLDFDDQTTPFECRMGWAVDLESGSFQGQSALKKLKSIPRTRVVAVVLSPSEGEFSGAKLTENGETVGTVSMAVPSPYLQGRILGMATIDIASAKVGTILELSGAKGATAEIVKMPVYDPKRIRAHS